MDESVISFKGLVGRGYDEFIKTKAFYRVVMGSRMSKKSKTICVVFPVKMAEQIDFITSRKAKTMNRLAMLLYSLLRTFRNENGSSDLV